MTANQYAVITELEAKVEQLIKLYTSSREALQQRESECTALREERERLIGETQQLNEEIKHLKVANALSSGGNNKEAKVKISQLVREIDKCIALLNN